MKKKKGKLEVEGESGLSLEHDAITSSALDEKKKWGSPFVYPPRKKKGTGRT